MHNVNVYGECSNNTIENCSYFISLDKITTRNLKIVNNIIKNTNMINKNNNDGLTMDFTNTQHQLEQYLESTDAAIIPLDNFLYIKGTLQIEAFNSNITSSSAIFNIEGTKDNLQLTKTFQTQSGALGGITLTYDTANNNLIFSVYNPHSSKYHLTSNFNGFELI